MFPLIVLFFHCPFIFITVPHLQKNVVLLPHHRRRSHSRHHLCETCTSSFLFMIVVPPTLASFYPWLSFSLSLLSFHRELRSGDGIKNNDDRTWEVRRQGRVDHVFTFLFGFFFVWFCYALLQNFDWFLNYKNGLQKTK